MRGKTIDAALPVSLSPPIPTRIGHLALVLDSIKDSLIPTEMAREVWVCGL